MNSIIQLPQGALADVLNATGTMFSDLWVLIAIAIGLPLAFYVIRRVIAIVPKGR